MHDLVVKDDDLVVATHGRSLWILDDLAPIRDLTPTAPSRCSSVPRRRRDPVAGWRRRLRETRGGFSNPPRGASIYYSLKEKAKGELKIEILDAQNRGADAEQRSARTGWAATTTRIPRS